MKFKIFLLAVLISLPVFAPAELSYQSVSVTATAQTVTIGTGALTIVNDGTNEVYVRIFWEGETASAATTAYAEIKANESLEFSRTLSIASISLVCAASESATVRLFYW